MTPLTVYVYDRTLMERWNNVGVFHILGDKKLLKAVTVFSLSQHIRVSLKRDMHGLAHFMRKLEAFYIILTSLAGFISANTMGLASHMGATITFTSVVPISVFFRIN